MTTRFTINEDNVFESAQFVSLTNRARLLFQDVVRTGKRVNHMGLFEPEKSKPFGFHLRHVTGRISRSRFYEYIQDLQAVGFIDIISPRRPGLAQQIVLNGVYANLVAQPVHELCGVLRAGTVASSSGGRPLKDSTLSRRNVNVAFNLLRPWKSREDRKEVEEYRPGYRDVELETDLRAIPGRIEGLAGRTLESDYAKMRMAEQLQQRAWIGYRSRQANPRTAAIDPHGVLGRMLEGVAVTSAARSEKWTRPAQRVEERIVCEIIDRTGDEKSEKNWRLLVHRMSETEKGWESLERVVYDFLDGLARMDPRARVPDSPGAVLNGLLRDECRVLGVDLGPRDSKSPT